ncbi:MAG: hypothetical protein ACXVXO_12060 [Mycobacteriaceae bacterium]
MFPTLRRVAAAASLTGLLVAGTVSGAGAASAAAPAPELTVTSSLDPVGPIPATVSGSISGGRSPAVSLAGRGAPGETTRAAGVATLRATGSRWACLSHTYSIASSQRQFVGAALQRVRVLHGGVTVARAALAEQYTASDVTSGAGYREVVEVHANVDLGGVRAGDSIVWLVSVRLPGFFTGYQDSFRVHQGRCAADS